MGFYGYGQVSEKTAQVGEFIKLVSDAGDNPRFAVADVKRLLKLYEEQYAYLEDTLVKQIAKLLGDISDNAGINEEQKARLLWVVKMLRRPVARSQSPGLQKAPIM